MEQTDARGRIDAFVRRARAKGCVELSGVDRLVEELGLPDDAVDALYGRLDDEGIELRDDCGQVRMASMYANGELAQLTVDTLGLFLNEIGSDDDVPRATTAVARELGLSWGTVKRLETEALAELGTSRELDALREAA